MNTRSKLIAAFVGLVVAAGATSEASARTFHKSHAVVATSKTILVHKAPRPLVATHFAKRVHIAHRAPVVVKHVRVVHRAPVAIKKVVRITKRPLLARQVVAHRTIVKRTVIR